MKRLAVKVEDHPLDYRDFEGTIPGGNYGAGAVIVWDEGTFTNLTTRRGEVVPVGEAVAEGHVSVWLQGAKLVGGWALTRFNGANWALVKRNDDRAAPTRDITSEEPRSVKTGRTLDQVRQGAAPSERAGPPGLGDGAGHRDGANEAFALPAGFLPPMLAQLEAVGPGAASVALGAGAGEWLYEPKLDGLRCIAVRNGPEVTLFSRNRLSFNARFPSIVQALGRLPVDNFVIDGELVGMVEGRADFGALQQGAVPAQLWAFDLPWLLGRDLRHLPIEDRKVLLGKTVTEGGELKVVRPLEGDPAEVVRGCLPGGLGGSVAKRAGSRYTAGRSSDWRKLKCGYRQELVVGRFHGPPRYQGRLRRPTAGLLGRGRAGYAGKVGTGFDRAELAELCAARAGRAGNIACSGRGPTEPARWVEPETGSRGRVQ